jgi:general secretion pathway protein J
MAMLAGGMRIAAKSTAAADAAIDRSSELRIAENVLRARLLEAYPLSIRIPGEPYKVEFTGGETEAEFISFMPDQIGMGGLYHVRIVHETVGGIGDLVLALQRVNLPKDGPVPIAERETRVLVEGAKSVRLRYFGAGEGEREARWRSRWQDEEALPVLVALAVEFPPGDNRTWPELVVAPKTTGTADCIFEASVKKCRSR